jgi:hypothetical protein
MDARAVELVNAAYDRFGGAEPGSSSADARLAKARTQLGVVESPAHSNFTPYGAWYGMDGQPWCAMFVTWCDQLSGAPSRSFARGSRYAYVPYIVNDARLGANGLAITSSPKAGDVVCFDWARDGEYDHVGIVAIAPDFEDDFLSVEGNTGPDDYSNGGQVMEVWRDRSAQGTVFVRVSEP